LESIATGLTNGDHGGLKYTASGVRYLRGQAVTEFGLELARDELYISEEEHSRMIRAEVLPGDVLYTIAGSTGNACVVSGISRANINQAIVRVRPGKSVVPQYLADFLNSSLGRLQGERKANGGVQLNINFSEVKSLQIIMPSVDVQRRLVAELDAARTERDLAIEESKRLLSSIDEMVIEKLGLPDLEPSQKTGYAIRLSTAKVSNSLSADYFHPERMQVVKLIQKLPNASLFQLVNFKRNIIKSPGDSRYIGLASVASDTGQLTGAVETAKGQCFAVEPGDVLYGRLRPYLNKVWLATFKGVCSTEFHVIKPLDLDSLRPEYLAVVMRTSLIVSQTKHMMTGNTHPRIANEDVGNLLIPLTDADTQQLIVDETIFRQSESKRLISHAETVWRKAREQFEKQLLQGVNS